MLQRMDERLLKEICKYLKPASYQQGQSIMEEGSPLDKMLFIRQGIVKTYRTYNKGDRGIRNFNYRFLEQGDVYGEELLDWVSSFTSSYSSNMPKSTRNVQSVNKVDVFALKAEDLETVVTKCWWHFTKDKFLYQFNQVQLELLKKFAVSAIERRVLRIKTQQTKMVTGEASEKWRRAAGMIVKDHVPIGAPSQGS